MPTEGRATTSIRVAGFVEYAELNVLVEEARSHLAGRPVIRRDDAAAAASLLSRWDGLSTEAQDDAARLLSRWQDVTPLEGEIEYPDYDSEDPGAGGCRKSCQKNLPQRLLQRVWVSGAVLRNVRVPSSVADSALRLRLRVYHS